MRRELGVCTHWTRRRFIGVFAAVAAGSLIPGALRARELKTFTWRGVALGAEAELTLQHHDVGDANAAIAACLAEIERLERIFSLHLADSALSRLNRSGRIDDAPIELRELLAMALSLSRQSDGAFDPTIQPLWRLYASHFESPDAPPDGPSRSAIEAVLRRVDWRQVKIEGAAVFFGAPAMAVTLNGIAQGYITDRVGALLSARGFEHVLVNVGEGLALGPKWDGASWTIGIPDPADPSACLTEIALDKGAIATSGSYGYRFDPAGRFTHLLDPKTGRPSRALASVTVLADSAALADGLSTALSVASPDKASAILGGRGRAYLVPSKGAQSNNAWRKREITFRRSVS